MEVWFTTEFGEITDWTDDAPPLSVGAKVSQDPQQKMPIISWVVGTVSHVEREGRDGSEK